MMWETFKAGVNDYCSALSDVEKAHLEGFGIGLAAGLVIGIGALAANHCRKRHVDQPAPAPEWHDDDIAFSTLGEDDDEIPEH